jgi:hypothetical protein
MPQTVGAYLVAIISILTAADLIFPGLQISDTHYRWLVTALVGGIPVVVTLSWFYDITSHGIVRTLAGDAEPPGSAASPRSVADVISGPIESVAILPFVNTSEDE